MLETVPPDSRKRWRDGPSPLIQSDSSTGFAWGQVYRWHLLPPQVHVPMIDVLQSFDEIEDEVAMQAHLLPVSSMADAQLLALSDRAFM